MAEFRLIVEPVFPQHGKNVKIHNRMEPFVGAAFAIAEVAVADTEAPSQRFVEGDLPIQILYLAISSFRVSLFRLFWYWINPSVSKPGSISKKLKRRRSA